MIFLKELTLISVKKHLLYVDLCRFTLCRFYYFLDKNFGYGPFLCNGCYDMSLKAVSMHNLTIINLNGNHYRVNSALLVKKMRIV